MMVGIGFFVYKVTSFITSKDREHFATALAWLIYLSIMLVLEDLLALTKCGTIHKECINGYIPMGRTVQMGYLFWCLLAAVEFGNIVWLLVGKQEREERED